MAPYRRVLPTPTATAVAALLLALTWSGTTCLAADLGFNKVIVPCNGSSTFQCAGDGKCILSKYKCDGVKHCTDNSDEVGCGNEKCDEKQHFTCQYIQFSLNCSFPCNTVSLSNSALT